jgi:SPX domain protein involved in polyphosphate accumulation
MDTLHFERYEYKYFFPEERSEAIRRFIRPYVAIDRHAAQSPGGRYTIRNIYLDTPRLDLYSACVNDEVDRFKLRIRWYGEEPKGPFFFEVKRKIRNVILKDRAKISAADVRALLRGEPLSLPEGPTRDHLMAFLDRVVRHGMVPCVFSRYTREPYESVFGDYARLTLDRAMCYQPAQGRAEDPRRWAYTDASWATGGMRQAGVLELKFTREFPRWMADLAAEFELERIGYSKYVAAVGHRLDTGHGGRDFDRRPMVWGTSGVRPEPAEIPVAAPALRMGV